MGFDPTSFAIGKASGGGGGGVGGTLAEEWDFTSATPLVGKKLGITLTSSNVEFSQDGATFNQTSSKIAFENFGCADLFHKVSYSSITIEAKVKTMSLQSGTHRRFVMGSGDNGLIYRSTGVWAFFSKTWQDFSETDGALFDNSVVKVVIDADEKWHVYKDNVLMWEPGKSQNITAGSLGSGATGINNAVIEWLKIEAVTA